MVFVCVFAGHSVLSFLRLLEMLVYSVRVHFLFANFNYNIVNFITRKTELNNTINLRQKYLLCL